jgi:hypothetical protein
MHAATVSLAAISLLATLTTAAQATLLIRGDDRGQRGNVIVRAGAESCTLQFSGNGKPVTCRLRVAPGETAIVLERDMRYGRDFRNASVKGTQRVKIVDVGAVLAPLRKRDQPFSARTRAFIAAHAKLNASDPDFADATAYIEPGPTHPLSAIPVAEKRLGFKLPPEYVDLVTKAGALQIDDSSFEDPTTLANAWDQMIHNWETPEKEMRKLPASIAQFLRQSVILFTEVGDGYGAMLVRPATKECGDGPAYYFTHQDELAGAPHLITNSTGGCGDFTDATIWLINHFVLEAYDGMGAGFVLVDRGSAREQTRELYLRDSERLLMKFNVVWD